MASQHPEGEIGVACLIIRLQEDKEQDLLQLVNYLEQGLKKRGVPPQRIYKLISAVIRPDDVLQLLKCVRWSTTATAEGRQQAPTDILYVHCPAKTDGKEAYLRLTGVFADGRPNEESEATLKCSEVVQAVGSTRPYVFFDAVYNTGCWLTGRLERTRPEDPATQGIRANGLNHPEKDVKRICPRDVTFQLAPQRQHTASDPVVVFSSDPVTETPCEVANLLGDSLARELVSRRVLRSLPQATARGVLTGAPQVLSDANHSPLLLLSADEVSNAASVGTESTGEPDIDETEVAQDEPAVSAELQVAEPRLLYLMDHISDLTLPDHSEVLRGTPLRKEWRVLNPGVRWPPGCFLVCYSGFPSCIRTRVEAPELNTGDEHIFAVDFSIGNEPKQPRYQASWRMQDPKGSWFGEWLTLEVCIAEGDSNPDVQPMQPSITAGSTVDVEGNDNHTVAEGDSNPLPQSINAGPTKGEATATF